MTWGLLLGLLGFVEGFVVVWFHSDWLLELIRSDISQTGRTKQENS